jgi:hypothetical protein
MTVSATADMVLNNENARPRRPHHASVMRSAQNPYMTPVPIFPPRA